MTAASCPAPPVTGLEASASRSTGGACRAGWLARLEGCGALLDGSRVEHVLLVLVAFALVLPLLHVARAADGNTFTSWRWTSTGPRTFRLVLVLLPALLAAAVAARVSLRVRAAPVLVACLAGAAVIPLWAEPETILDASRYLVQATHLERYGTAFFLREWGRGIEAWTDLPLVPFLYGLVLRAGGETRAFLQALDTILFAATVLLTSRIGRALWDDEAGLNAALLLAGVPFLLVSVPLLLVDVPAMFFLTLFAWTSIAAVRIGGAARVAACAAAAAAAALTKYSLWPLVLATSAAIAVAAGGERGRGAARMGAALLLAGLAVGAVIAVRPDVFLHQVRLLATFQGPGLGRWREGLLSAFLFQAHPLVFTLALLGVARAAAARDRRFALAGAALLLAIPIASTRMRYALPLLPLVVLASSQGLAVVKDRGARRLVSLCVVASALVVAYGAYLPFLRGTSLANLASAGVYLDALPDPAVEVRVVPQRRSSGSTAAAIPLLAYATRKRIVCPDAWPVRGEDGATRTSPLRFTWEMSRPSFYSAASAPAGAGEAATVVVLSGEPPGEEALPRGLRERARFTATSGVFEYRTFVTVYTRDPRTRP